MSKAEIIALGQQLVTSGEINPEKEMRQYERTGYMSRNGMFAWCYWDYGLREWADSAAETFGPRSKEFREAEGRWDDWQKRLRKAIAAWEYMRQSMQG
jgi:hypothetical protein